MGFDLILIVRAIAITAWVTCITTLTHRFVFDICHTFKFIQIRTAGIN